MSALFVCWRYHKTSVTDDLLLIMKQIDIKQVNFFIKSFNINEFYLLT